MPAESGSLSADTMAYGERPRERAEGLARAVRAARAAYNRPRDGKAQRRHAPARQVYGRRVSRLMGEHGEGERRELVRREYKYERREQKHAPGAYFEPWSSHER